MSQLGIPGMQLRLHSEQAPGMCGLGKRVGRVGAPLLRDVMEMFPKWNVPEYSKVKQTFSWCHHLP